MSCSAVQISPFVLTMDPDVSVVKSTNMETEPSVTMPKMDKRRYRVVKREVDFDDIYALATQDLLKSGEKSIQAYYFLRDAKSKLKKGNLLSLRHLQTYEKYFTNLSLQERFWAVECFKGCILKDYDKNRAFFLKYNQPFALDEAAEDLRRYNLHSRTHF